MHLQKKQKEGVKLLSIYSWGMLTLPVLMLDKERHRSPIHKNFQDTTKKCEKKLS